MVIYADVLFLLNTVTDYFLIKLSGCIANRNATFWRLGLSAIIGGLSSFYIFIPKVGLLIDLPLKITLCALLIFIAYGFEDLKTFIRLSGSLFSITLLLGGIVSAVVFYLKPENVYINNNVSYIDIDPLIFVLSGVLYYFVAMIFKHLTEKSGEFAKQCKVNLFIRNTEFSLTGLIDTGNSLSDLFGSGEIIITEKDTLEKIKAMLDESERMRRFRTVPVKTVTGNAVLDGIRIDRANIELKDNKKTLINPIIVASNTGIKDGFGAIINPRSII